MEKRICPRCSKPVYSADSSNDWVCVHCGATVPIECSEVTASQTEGEQNGQ